MNAKPKIMNCSRLSRKTRQTFANFVVVESLSFAFREMKRPKCFSLPSEGIARLQVAAYVSSLAHQDNRLKTLAKMSSTAQLNDPR